MLTKQASAMRIVDLNRDGQRTEITLPSGLKLGCTFRKRKRGGWRIELDDYPDGTRILTREPKVK